MSRVRTVLAVGATLLGTVGLPAVTTSGAQAAATTLYVNNSAKAACSDGGTGTQARPFCTVAAAAAAVLPGQTVQIADGTYLEPVTVDHSGTAEAPVIFRGPTAGQPAPYNSGWAYLGTSDKPGGGVTVKGAEHVRFELLKVLTGPQAPAVLVDGSRDVSFSEVGLAGGPALRITNGSERVSAVRSGVADVLVDGGSTGTVLSTNRSSSVRVDNAPGTVVVSNTLGDCSKGLVLTGASAGTTVENNVINTVNERGERCDASTPAVGITVDRSATAGLKLDYNVVDSRSGSPAYDWADTGYTDRAAFTAASGQGAHDFVEPTYQDARNRPDASKHQFDSADENAPGMLTVDLKGNTAQDDPTVPNTGTGSGTRDRGAYEDRTGGSAYTPVGPVRLLDTREAIGVPSARAVAPGETVDLPVTGVAGVPADGVTAVTMTVTATEPTQDGDLAVRPFGYVWSSPSSLVGERETTSTLNWTAGRTVPNQVTVPVKDGKVSFYNHSGGTVHVIADLAGYYSTKGDLFQPQDPVRVLDTREPIGVPSAQAVPAFGTLELPVADAAGATAVTMNVTVTEPEQEGHLTVYPHGGAAPDTSNLNWTAGRTVAGLVTVPVKDGKVSFYNHSGGTVHLVADLVGQYAAGGTAAFYTAGPARVMDTRSSWARPQYRTAGVVPAWGSVTVYVAWGSNPAVMTLNVTVTEPGAEGHLKAFSAGSPPNDTSVLNFAPGDTVANQVVVPMKKGSDQVTFYNASGAPLHLVVDRYGVERY
ncbi:right-handed parallel beta-helix repeat-containing protein [Kitasatospora purpeofusca]|uniref:right-handed parallel beta-helix repeat-containing protein n=1 Tax=Kitasatospora purpeofusca TaxID=67352 RepID=UPI002A59F252|nr:right-handed parallel beta-helix repeat-containing protein [Kitasatospora purpeofusca]MDY0810511.1 right-handed parallel beta-helix repeat-containing protein [Kitasatospora purpeofusca]